MKTTKIIYLFVLLLPSFTFACINSYTMELRPEHFDSVQQRIDYYQTKFKKNKQDHAGPYTLQQKNDDAVLLILMGQYQQAISILEALERSHPNLPKTAVNLGTAYELNGQLLQARKWVRIGMQRDPNIHEGSEWIHMNILNAKLNHADVTWLNQNPVLNLTFGSGYAPQPNHIHQDHIDQVGLERIFEQAKLQIAERKQFVFGKDPILARMYYDLANIEQSLYSENMLNRMLFNQEANALLDFAQSSGLQKDSLIKKRITMISANTWQRVWMYTHDYFSNWFS